MSWGHPRRHFHSVFFNLDPPIGQTIVLAVGSQLIITANFLKLKPRDY